MKHHHRGLKTIPVFSFHKCGGSVGDYVNIPIPNFVLEGGTKPYFVDASRHTENAYISFAYDNVKIGQNNERTSLEMYSFLLSLMMDQSLKLKSVLDHAVNFVIHHIYHITGVT